MLRSLTTVAVLTFPPTDAQAEKIARDLITERRPEVTNPVTAAEYTLEWFTSPELPPAGLPTYEEDQLSAHMRDAGPQAVYFTVLVERI